MQAGKKTIDKLTAAQMKELLNSIIKDCINYAGDSYADFGEAVTKTLYQKKLVDYGIGKEQEMIQKYGLNNLYYSLKDEHLNMLFEACDYDIDVIRNWEKSIEYYFNGRAVSTDEFLNAYNNDTLQEYAAKFSENYHKAKEDVERD